MIFMISEILTASCFLFCVSILIIYVYLKSIRKKPYSEVALSRLKNQIVVITGASSGLGEELARVFYQHGCKLILASRRVDELERVKQELMSLDSIYSDQRYEPKIVMLDLSFENLDMVMKSAEELVDVYGRIDILINNAGISSRAKAIETKSEVDRLMMFVNYLNQITVTKVVLKSMMTFAQDRQPGHIVAISSLQGRFAIPYRSSYSASKHALQAFYDSLRAELSVTDLCERRRPIKITVVSPGYIRTNLSMNALTSDGTRYAKMDRSTELGLPPSVAANEVLESVINEDPELILSDMLPSFLIPLRGICPPLFFYIMNDRAKENN